MSSIPSDSPWRGCAANFAQPVAEEDVLAAQDLVQTVYKFNCRIRNPPLAAIVYRNSDSNQDVLRQVFRWDITPYEQIFQNGFQVRRQQGTADNIYFDLNHYVHHGGRPLDSTRPAKHVFISTTLDPNWRPKPALQPGHEFQAYRYEIYAPGGIWVTETLCNLYRYPAQDEVCFVSGIVPQYIRSAQLFIATREAGLRQGIDPRWRKQKGWLDDGGCNDGSKERKEKRTLENDNGKHERTTGEGPRVAVIGVHLQVVMATVTQPCDCRSMNGKKDGSRANQKCSFLNLLGQDHASEGKN